MPNDTRQIPPPDIERIYYSIGIARRNWNDWRAVFEHNGSVGTNPLLTSRDNFKAFVREYSVGRTIRKGTHESFRCKLRDSQEFAKAIADDSGEQLVKLQEEWREEFGTRKEKEPRKINPITSVLSKIAAFVRPERFVAWDNYAKRGLNIACGKPVSHSFKNNYAAYLAEIDTVCLRKLGQAIRDLTAHSSEYTVEREPRFQRRVLDVYLMKLGGRDIKYKAAGAD